MSTNVNLHEVEQTLMKALLEAVEKGYEKNESYSNTPLHAVEVYSKALERLLTTHN